MDNSTIAVIVSIVVLAISLAKDIFGGGGKLAAKFSALDTKFATLEKETTAGITAMRFEFIEKGERNSTNSKMGFEAITANIHALQLGFAEFRAKMGEEYMRRDSFYKATDELKRDFTEKHNELKTDVHLGFKETRDQLDAMAQAIEAGRQSAKPHATK